MLTDHIEFQGDLSLIEFIKEFHNEKTCREYLRLQKWPDGFCCRRCSYKRSSLQIQGIREMHECLNCFYKESLLAYTVFEHSHLPLNMWFLAIQLLTHTTNYMSTMELHRHLNVNIKTARKLRTKIMEVITNSEGKYVL